MSHLDEIEGREGMRNMAVLTWAYYDGLREAGFGARAALRLTSVWLNAVVSGQKSDDS